MRPSVIPHLPMNRSVFLVALTLHIGWDFALGFVPLQPTYGRDAVTLRSVPTFLDVFTSGLASIGRLQSGVTVRKGAAGGAPSSIQLRRLYDVENSHDCRKVREWITELDRTVDRVVPAARNSRAVLDPTYEYALPGGASVPCLIVEDGSGEQRTLSGSDAIGEYLASTLGVTDLLAGTEDSDKQVIGVLKEVGNFVVGGLRAGRGSKVSPAALATRGRSPPRPRLPLILYSYEGNQFCRLVREVLTELDLVYELRNAGKQSPRRTELSGVSGGPTQCPFLVDPNADVKMAESADIVRYLYKQYALWTPPSELLQWISDVVLPLLRPLFAVLAPIQAGYSDADLSVYQRELENEIAEIQTVVKANAVVVYSYKLSPFSIECKALLDSLGVAYTEICLGQAWVPGLISERGPITRAALLQMTGQSSLPHVFVGGESVGGLFSGTPGLIPALESGVLPAMIAQATSTGTVETKAFE